MANTNSNLMANIVALPRVHNPVGQQGGRVRVACGNFELAAADIDADGDTVRLALLPANARILQIWIGGDDLDSGSNLSWNIGLYEPGTDSTGPGSLVVTAATDGEVMFASGVTQQAVLQLGATNLVSEDWVDGDAKITFFGDRLWELAEDTQGAFPEYEIVLTQTTAATGAAAGTMAFAIFYSID